MTYNQFIEDLDNHYYDLWTIGLKKQAKRSLEKYLQEFNASVNENARFDIWYQFCKHYFSNERSYKDLLLPYEIQKNIIDYLNKFSSSMPQLKWLYHLTGDVNFLDKAFNHKDCDQEVIECKFDAYITQLDWGAHHASEGFLLISEEQVQENIMNSLSMIETYKLPDSFSVTLNYYVRLYELFKMFSGSDCKSFAEFCDLHKFPFNNISTFYYTK